MRTPVRINSNQCLASKPLATRNVEFPDIVIAVSPTQALSGKDVAIQLKEYVEIEIISDAQLEPSLRFLDIGSDVRLKSVPDVVEIV